MKMQELKNIKNSSLAYKVTPADLFEEDTVKTISITKDGCQFKESHLDGFKSENLAQKRDYRQIASFQKQIVNQSSTETKREKRLDEIQLSLMTEKQDNMSQAFVDEQMIEAQLILSDAKLVYSRIRKNLHLHRITNIVLFLAIAVSSFLVLAAINDSLLKSERKNFVPVVAQKVLSSTYFLNRLVFNKSYRKNWESYFLNDDHAMSSFSSTKRREILSLEKNIYQVFRQIKQSSITSSGKYKMMKTIEFNFYSRLKEILGSKDGYELYLSISKNFYRKYFKLG